MVLFPAPHRAQAIISQGFAMAYPYKGKDQGKGKGECPRQGERAERKGREKGKGESPRQGSRIRSVSQGNGLDWHLLWENIWELEEKWARQR